MINGPCRQVGWLGEGEGNNTDPCRQVGWERVRGIILIHADRQVGWLGEGEGKHEAIHVTCINVTGMITLMAILIKAAIAET